MTDANRAVFKYVNGKLERVPGDIRDPNRRYRATSNKIYGQCDIEFTDEEEKERDFEEAKWRAEEPQRIEAASKQESDFNNFKNSLQYENRIIAYLDILGWSEAIKNSENDPELAQKLGLGLGYIKLKINGAEFQQQHQFPDDLQITQFSDSIIISIKSDQSPLPFNFISNLKSIADYFLQSGHLLRGAVTSGQLIHRGSLVYGPALLKAIELEKEARVPRIICDPVMKSSLVQGVRVQNPDGSLIGYHKEWRLDKDGWAFYDVLQPFNSFPGSVVNLGNLEAQLNPVREIITQGLSKHRQNEKVLPKYEWMASYFNVILEEYKGVGIQYINIEDTI